MSLSIDQITQQIINQLRLSDPAVSAEIGTPERKIIEAVAEQLAAAQVDFSVLDSQHDIDSMAGGRLDAYLGNFGFGRQLATGATGTVTFSRTTPATADIQIPQGTQLIAPQTSGPDIIFMTTQSVTLANGTFSVDAPVQASISGTLGNVAANAITGFSGLKSVQGISIVSNAVPISGGTDGEDDAAFRARFKNSIFRNMAGTYDQFLALGASAQSVSKVNVVGPISRFQEYMQVPASNDTAQRSILIDANGVNQGTAGSYDPPGTVYPHKRTTAVSTNPYSKFTYDQAYYVTDGGLGAAATYLQPGLDFIFNRTPVTASSGTTQVINTTAATVHQPNLSFLRTKPTDTHAPDALQENGTVLLEHSYISKSSRNDYSKGILNAVDVFVNGSRPQSVKSQEIVPNNSNNLQSSNPGNWAFQQDVWKASTTFAVGTLMTPPTRNGFVYLVTASTGNTGGSPPTFRTDTTPFASGSATLQMVTSVSGIPVTDTPNFRRFDNRRAAVGNRLQVLYWQPVVSLPDTIAIGPNTYYQAKFYNSGDGNYYFDAGFTRSAHFAYVFENNGYYGTVRARNGIEWLPVNGYKSGDPLGAPSGDKFGSGGAAAGTSYTVNGYAFDQNISDLQAIMEKNKQVTTDVLVHAAKVRFFKIYVNVMYTPGATRSVVDSGIQAAVASFFNNQYYGSAVQLSDILQTVHNVPGVDNVRWTRDVNGSINQVEEVYSDGAVLDTGNYVKNGDFFIQDNELAASPSTNPVVIVVKAQNTWGVA